MIDWLIHSFISLFDQSIDQFTCLLAGGRFIVVWTWCYRYSEEMACGLMRVRYQTLFSSTLQTCCRDGLQTNSYQWYTLWTTITCKNILHRLIGKSRDLCTWNQFFGGPNVSTSAIILHIVPRNLAKWWNLRVGFAHYPETAVSCRGWFLYFYRILFFYSFAFSWFYFQ